jgi:hypothetical protein
MTPQKLFATLALMVLLCVPGCAPKPNAPHIQDVRDTVEPVEVPGDFEIVAAMKPGYSPWMGWQDTIHVDGNVAQKILGGRGSGNDSNMDLKLTKADVELLWTKVREAKFYQLKNKYRGGATDQSTLEIIVTRNKQTHRVSVYGDSFIEGDAERKDVNRFLTVFAEVVKLVPSPNPEETADSYKLK